MPEDDRQERPRRDRQVAIELESEAHADERLVPHATGRQRGHARDALRVGRRELEGRSVTRTLQIADAKDREAKAYVPSRTSRTLVWSTEGVMGFWRKATWASRRPWRTMLSSV